MIESIIFKHGDIKKFLRDAYDIGAYVDVEIGDDFVVTLTSYKDQKQIKQITQYIKVDLKEAFKKSIVNYNAELKLILNNEVIKFTPEYTEEDNLNYKELYYATKKANSLVAEYYDKYQKALRAQINAELKLL